MDKKWLPYKEVVELYDEETIRTFMESGAGVSKGKYTDGRQFNVLS